MKKITLVVTMHNEKNILEVSLKWLEQISDINKIIFIDNGSDDGTSEILPQTGYEYIIFDEGIQGYGTVWNAVIENFELDEVVIFMDMRYVPAGNCLRHLANAVSQKEIGIAGPLSNGFAGVQNIILNNTDELPEIERMNATSASVNVVGIDAGIWAISREELEKNGQFHLKLMEKQNVLMDYTLRMMQRGKHVTVCQNSIAFDLYRGKGNDVDTQIHNDNDRKIMKEKWHMNYFNRMPNPFLVDLIIEDKEKAFNVMEVGCDLGATLLEVHNRYPNSKIYGMEINKNAVEIAKNLIDIKEGNIEEENTLFPEKFDYIIFGDVLEHLHNPERTISFCKNKLLKENGCIIASIPNLMHISVIQQLLMGRFQYTDTGLLDRTHIHFFTYYEIILMFQNAGFVIEDVRTTTVGTTEEQQKLKTELLKISYNVEMFMYDTFQYVIKARS